MFKKITNNKIFDYLIVAYCLFTILYQVLNVIIPVRALIANLGLSFISPGLAVLGFGICAWDLLTKRIFFKTKFCYPLIVLLIIMGISALFTMQYGLTNNIKSIIWQAAQMLVIFPLYNRLSTAQWKTTLKWFYCAVSLIMLPSTLVSLLQYFFSIGYNAYVEGGRFRQGLSDGRLFGIFISPHFGSILLLLMVFWSMYYVLTSTKKRYRWICGVTAFLYFIAAALTGTRSVVVGCLCATLLIFFWIRKSSYLKIKKAGTRYITAIFSTICSMVLVVTLFSSTGPILSNFIVSSSDRLPSYLQPSATDNDADTDEIMLEDDEIITQRPDIGTENISNGRFAIWKDYIEITASSWRSFLIGNSTGNYMLYIRDTFPNSFIVEYITPEKYPVMYQKKLIYDVHNAYVGAFSTTGILGLGVLFVFLGWIFFKGIKYVLHHSNCSPAVYMLFGTWIFILVSSFFESDLFYKCTSTSVIFWLISGLLVMQLSKKEA